MYKLLLIASIPLALLIAKSSMADGLTETPECRQVEGQEYCVGDYVHTKYAYNGQTSLLRIISFKTKGFYEQNHFRGSTSTGDRPISEVTHTVSMPLSSIQSKVSKQNFMTCRPLISYKELLGKDLPQGELYKKAKTYRGDVERGMNKCYSSQKYAYCGRQPVYASESRALYLMCRGMRLSRFQCAAEAAKSSNDSGERVRVSSEAVGYKLRKNIRQEILEKRPNICQQISICRPYDLNHIERVANSLKCD